MAMKSTLFLGLSVMVLAVGCATQQEGAAPDSSSGSPSASTTSTTPTTVAYADIQAAFDQNCVKCHGATNPKDGVSLVDHASVMKGGEDGPVVVPGDPENSVLIQVLRGSHGKPQMPKGASPLPEDAIKKVEAWIEEGAKG